MDQEVLRDSSVPLNDRSLSRIPHKYYLSGKCCDVISDSEPEKQFSG
jgi:hypothetical protein